jgi:hypothetical protein
MDVVLSGSQFPSHRVGTNGDIETTIPQGAFADLWDCDPSAPSECVDIFAESTTLLKFLPERIGHSQIAVFIEHRTRHEIKQRAVGIGEVGRANFARRYYY